MKVKRVFKKSKNEGNLSPLDQPYKKCLQYIVSTISGKKLCGSIIATIEPHKNTEPKCRAPNKNYQKRPGTGGSC
jgi:hypothetical protein